MRVKRLLIGGAAGAVLLAGFGLLTPAGHAQLRKGARFDKGGSCV